MKIPPSALLRHVYGAATCLLFAVLAPAVSAETAIHQLDVGHGNCALVVSAAGRTAMIDTGSTQSVPAVLRYLQSLQLATVDMLFVSHADRDHFAGAAELAEAGIWFGEIWDNGHITNLPWVDQAAASHYHRAFGDRRETITAGMTWSLGSNTTVHCLYACGTYADGTHIDYDRVENDASAVLLVTVGQYRHLFPGDAHTGVERQLGKICGRVATLTVAHHGLDGSSSTEFLQALRPRVALLPTAGLRAFPSPEVIDRLEAVAAEVYLTRRGADSRGTVATNIVVRTDGHTGFTVEGYGHYTFPARRSGLRWAGIIIALLACYGILRAALARFSTSHR